MYSKTTEINLSCDEKEVMKQIKILLSITLFILLIGGGCYFWLTANAGPSLNAAEDALADKHLIAFAHLDNNKINTIVNATGVDLKSDFVADISPLLKALYFDAANFKDNVYQVMYGLSFNQTDLLATNSLLLHGLFSWQVMENTLKNHFTIEALGNNTFKLQPKINLEGDTYTCPDESTKKKSTSYYISISADWLILSDNLNQVDILLSRMANKDKAEIDLKPWREYRSGKLASFALYNPEFVGKSLGGMNGYIANSVHKKNTEISAIFSSLDLNYLTPGVHLNSQVMANKEWAKKYAQEGQNKIIEAKLSASDYSQILANLLNTLQVADDKNALVIDLVVTQNDIEKIPEAISEVLSSLFSFGTANGDAKEKITEESINKTPWDYANNKKLASLSAFKTGTFSGIPAFINGPFAINMDKVSIGKESGLIELDLKALMSIEKVDGFWSHSKANLSLSVDSIVSADQQELLKDERCDKKLPRFAAKNQQAAEGFHSDNDHAYVSKTIRLIPTAKFNQIKEIKGSLHLHAPVGVSLVDIDFKKGKGFKGDNVEFLITKAQQQTATYKRKGNTENILEVRALNSKGQVLDFSSSFGNDDSMVATYRGDIAKLQLVIVHKWLDKNIDFTVKSEDLLKGKASQQYKISRLPSSASKKHIKQFSSADFSEVTPKEIKKVSYASNAFVGATEISPVKLFISHDYQSSWSFQPKLHVVMPLIEPLAFNLQAVAVEVEQETPFKTFVNAGVGYFINDGKTIGNYNGHIELGKFEYLINQVDLALPLKSGEKLSTIKGKLSYQLPKEVQHINVTFPELGQVVNVSGVELRLTAIEAGFMSNYTFEVSGDELINIVAITDQGSFYSTNQNYSEGKWLLTYRLKPNIRALKVLLATEKENVTMPFKIDINYD
jgi:hypothetical protein